MVDGINVRSISDRQARVTGLAYDSRQVEPGSAFFALPGIHTDGHSYIAEAVRAGAVAVVHSKEVDELQPNVTYVQVEDVRRELSRAAHRFYDEPSDSLTVIGVTGTDGKSTTVYLIYQLLERLGLKTGFISTVNMKVDAAVADNTYRQSTPEAPEIHEALARMRAVGLTHAVVEATSHGLSHKTSRLRDVSFDIGVFTNLSHEHLEFHGSFDQYRSDKANLFRALPKTGLAVINAADENAAYFAEQTEAALCLYGVGTETELSKKAELFARDLEADLSGTSFALLAGETAAAVETAGAESIPARLNLPGAYNVENALAAVAVARKLSETPLSEIGDVLPKLNGVKGRFTPVVLGQPFSVIVDYAHTPGSFARLLPWVREHVSGRLILVFGSAGERDRDKRRLQGEIACGYADVLVLTDEDPRLEDPMTIINQIATGCPPEREREVHRIPDRRRAIRHALVEARAGDAVLFLGKGHEASIIYASGKIAWDEESEVRDALKEMGYENG
jgi:UDP-N-acetylmuramoyl-L-alanyl-D-glutamate--2,6-diaminopimelate ligase